MTSDLITRLSKLDAPDPRVDVLIENKLGLAQFKRVETGYGASNYERYNIQPLTGSVDAAIALAEKVLPELSPQVGRNVHHKYWHASVCRINDNMADGIEYYDATHDVAAIALCIALLRAKEASNVGN